MQWIKCSDRLPTEADGDVDGDVIVRYRTLIGVVIDLAKWNMVEDDWCHEWLAGACKREGEGCNQ